MKITKKLIVLILTIAFLTESAGVGYALRPMATAVLKVPSVKPGYVHIKNLQTGKEKIILRKTFLNQLEQGKLKNVLVTEMLDSNGILRLGETSYGQPYIACTLPNYADRVVQYKLKDGIASNIRLFSKTSLLLESHTLAVAKDVFGKEVDSFLPKDELPVRIRSLIKQGRVNSIEHLFIGQSNTFELSPGMVYDFEKKGNFKNKEATAYYWGKTQPVQFTMTDDDENFIDINTRDVLTTPLKKNGKPTILGREEIREALALTMQEISPRLQPIAMAVIANMYRSYENKPAIEADKLAKTLKVDEKDVKKAYELLVKLPSLSRVVNSYGIEHVSAEQEKWRAESRLLVRPPSFPPDGYVYIRQLDSNKVMVIKRRDLITQLRNGKLDNVEVLYDILDSEGIYKLGYIREDESRGKNVICAFTRFPNKRIRYIIRNGKVDKTTIILLGDKGFPLENPKLRYAVDVETGELRCHLPESMSKDLRFQLDNVIVYARVNHSGDIIFGRTKSGKKNLVAVFSNHGGRRAKFRVYAGEADRTTVLLLNKDGSIYKDKDARYAAYPDTDEIKCHLPDRINKNLRTRLESLIMYARTNSTGTIEFGPETEQNSRCAFTNHRNTRIKFRVHNAGIDKTTTLLLNENGTILRDPYMRYTMYPDTDKVRCHLQDSLLPSLLAQLEKLGLEIYDTLNPDGYVRIHPGGTKGHQFKGHPYRRVKHKLKKAEVDKATIILLDDNGYPLNDGKTRYLIDLKTSRIKCHLPQKLKIKDWIDILNNTEVVNANLISSSHGELTIVGVKCYRNKDHAGEKAQPKIYNKKLVSITILGDDNKVLLQEILDEELAQKAFLSESGIEYLKLPTGERIITFAEFRKRFLSDYNELIGKKIPQKKIMAIMQKRLYELLDVNTFFYFGRNLRADLQLEFKSIIARDWLYMSQLSTEGVPNMLLTLESRFRQYTKATSRQEPESPILIALIPRELIDEIKSYKQDMIEGGKEHAREIDLSKEKQIIIKKNSKTQEVLDTAA